jgi:hypothetical protein
MSSNLRNDSIGGNGWEFDYLVHHSAIDALMELGNPRDSFERSLQDAASRFTRFPDGSIQFAGSSAARLFHSEYATKLAEAAIAIDRTFGPLNRTSIYRGSCFYGLRYFGRRIIEMSFWGNFARKLTDGSLSILMGNETPGLEVCPCPAKEMQVTVVFVQRFTKSIAESFVKTLLTWHSAVAECGIAGEGAACLLGTPLTVWTKACRFGISIENAGQTSVNWLLMCLISFMPQCAIESVFFTQAPGARITFEELYGLKNPRFIALK